MIIHKTVTSDGEGLTFVLSDNTLDRMGDIIEPAGWDLKAFKQNPIALFSHNSSFPIGTWSNIEVKGNQLLGRLKLAARGTSARIDELISLVEQGILRAVSVGFRPIAAEPINAKDPIFGGQRFLKQELVETSLVSVPANPGAVAIARSLNLSPKAMSIVFGEQAGIKQKDTSTNGKQAVTSSRIERAKPMTTLAQRITDADAKLLALRDTLTAHIEKAGTEPDETDMTLTDELNGKIAIAQRSVEQLREAERQLATQSVQVVERSDPLRRPLSVSGPKLRPGELVMRALVAKLIAQAHGQKDALPFLAERYGSDGKVDDQTRAVFNVVTRSPTIPADTTTSGWASQLVETQIAEFMALLIPASVYPSLSAKGLRLNFGRSGIISIPSRVSTPTIAGAFIAQGAPIPVKQGAFTSVPLSPKKLAVISTFTREIAEHSTPAIEGLIRDAMQEDTSVAIDTVLLGNAAATAIAPAGIRNGASTTAVTAGGGFAALVGDIKALLGALITSTNGNLRNPVWIMNPVQAIAASLTQNAGGDFPFASEIAGNKFQGYPLIISSTVAAGMLILIDAADFVSVEGDAPKFDVSDQATLHMETSPLQIATGVQGSGVLATPTQSLWQTDTMAIRMIMDLNWTLRRAGVVAWTSAVTW